ncbi:MAG: hypothetical protein KatS3mg087_1871 [Patescibacteria group bacterium]|nr:MAG: hypothetical protein KatS3mg087_1871 [Patescibacteria group bacterium]
MNVLDFESSAASYERLLNKVRAECQLPDKWFERLDHVAVKCKDSNDYLVSIESLNSLFDTETLGEIRQVDLRLASARFMTAIHLGGSEFGMIEIMEPRLNANPIKETFVEHTEFTVDDLLTIYNGLTCRIAPNDSAVKVFDDRASYHQGIVLEFGDGLEVTFNETSLAEMVVNEQRQNIWENYSNGS